MRIQVYRCKLETTRTGRDDIVFDPLATRYSGVGAFYSFNSPEAMPHWLQERWAVIRLLDGGVWTPLGSWLHTGISELTFYYIPQPGDPKLGGE